jgi:hypothetical protein
MDRLRRQLSGFVALVSILLVAGPAGSERDLPFPNQDVPLPVCYAINTFVDEVGNAGRTYSSGDNFSRANAVDYARMQLELTYNQYRSRIPFDYRVDITTSADELLRELSRRGPYRDSLGIESRLLGLCPAG